jgi:hypothetical protein
MGVAQSVVSPNLMDRVKAILMRPKVEWPLIEAEQTDISTIFRSYAIPLAAIGPVANAIGIALIGTPTIAGVGGRVSIVTAIVGALIAFALALLGTYVVAQVIDNLAPRYGGTRNLTQAFKVSAYSSTAQWLAGVFAVIPALSPLSILGLYSLYLLYLGLPVLMKVPQEKAMSYTVAVVVVALIVLIVIAVISGLIIGGAAIATQ